MATLSPQMGMAMMVDINSVSVSQAVSYIIAWGIMMAAMMLPSALPMIMLYGTLRVKQLQVGQKGVPTYLFMLVYLFVWLLTGLPIYLINLGLGLLEQTYASFDAAMPYVLGVSFVGAGLFQFSELKRRCLKVCQSPFTFLMGHWYTGYKGTLRLSFEHAFYCVGCCWALMGIMALIGSMSLRWVLLITVAVFIEKILPRGEWYANLIGVVLIVLGLVVAFRPDLLVAIQGPPMYMGEAQISGSGIPVCSPEFVNTLK
ncbi:hypothetical protein GCM10023187_39020 [Nibrella viscosa]|uniref:DUF2182 domain-containing protein n=1 Tax=Nibrella viscosa TaxID=1084524 RepID=A0ABP8KQ58_9BACT